MTIRIAVVDDNEAVRSGIRLSLLGEDDFEVVGEAADGSEAAELCRRVRPDLILMDVRMRRTDGLSATREVKRSYPNVGVLILTMHENQDYLVEAVRAGAAGYVLKDATQEELAEAIRKVHEGETALDEKLSAKVIQSLARNGDDRRPPERPGAPGLTHPLTPRELQVLQTVAKGRTNPEIARELGIKTGTVKNHVERIIAKLGVSDRTQAVVKALEMRLISFPGEQPSERVSRPSHLSG
ncbi:Response regulator containing a CheY-like receiver domain and an HTH DNA-binding domain [Rubrobacter radiotolerans]|uniref:Response regulator containing a CheY-like receiver domain and an HTH DNA-binding domain n=1 Tax=Rubrobacter radiotolerans TaxID=42256 RepID=A0A023X591_RUBRA|nr:response regulator transcription factor [Rubrobacter radiotolerans]AHY47386.1 Response regulator containing a CheY-like receiver domain and an HTH DNA-binding domain [Rubrobacter radiotolerans]MDX5894789.1 response regulator transcription factor [Rubrobacter radiotolerans]SMC06767.1 two component transcriptional regulator, LuxR family [Rubrobacter radiotolerans DSM 5868]